MSETRLYLDLSDDALFEDWHAMETTKDYPMFRWSKGRSKIKLGEMGGVWCTFKIAGGKKAPSNFNVLLDGKVKVVEGEVTTLTDPKTFGFYIPAATKFLSVETQAWRPCDLGFNTDGRTLGVGISEVCFYSLDKALPVTNVKRATDFLKRYEQLADERSWDESLECISGLVQEAEGGQARIAAIFGGIIFLLKQFPGQRLCELDSEGKLAELTTGIDLPYFDVDGEVAAYFVKYAAGFSRTSLDGAAKKTWGENVSFLEKEILREWQIKSIEDRVFVLSENTSFLVADGNIYLNSSRGNFLKKLYMN